MNAIPTPPPLPVAAPGLLTSVESVLRIVLERIDVSRATPEIVADALHAAGVTVSRDWAADWIERTRRLYSTNERHDHD